jgi:hypothetical protein
MVRRLLRIGRSLPGNRFLANRRAWSFSIGYRLGLHGNRGPRFICGLRQGRQAVGPRRHLLSG